MSRTFFILAIVAALVLMLFYGWLAFNWQSRPFLGVMYSQTLTIEGVYAMSADPWPAFEAGMRPGDRIVGIGLGQSLDADYRVASKQLNDFLLSKYPSAPVMLRIERPLVEGVEATRDHVFCEDAPAEGAPATGGVEKVPCTVNFQLAAFPIVDFLIQFVVGYAVGVAFLALSLIILRRFWNQPVARTIGALSLVMAVLVAGIFDVYTTQVLSATLLPVSVVIVGGLLQGLFLNFPSPLVLVKRRPWLRYVPVILTLAVGVAVLVSAAISNAETFWQPWDFAAVYLLASIVVLVLGLVRRLRWAISPSIRDKCGIVLSTSLLTVVPLLVWIVSDAVQAAFPDQNLSFHFSLVTPFLYLFTLGFFYAIAQERLPNTDAWLRQGLIYSLMGVAIALGYGLLVTGFTILTGSFVQANNPLVIAITIFLMALLFVPIRNALERRIDSAYFRKHRLYQQRVEALAQELTTVSTLGGVVEAIRGHLNDTLAPTHTFVFFPNLEAELYVAHGVPMPETDIRFDIRSPLVSLLSRQHRALYLEPGQELPPELALERARLAVLSAPVLVPMSGQNRLSGILVVGPRQTGERYHYEDLNFVQSLADQAALAVERAQVVANLEQRVQEMNVLGQVAQAVNFTIEFDDLLELIYAQTNRVINAPNFYIALRDPNTDEMYYAFYTEDEERIVDRESVRWRMGRDLLSEIARTGRPVRVENYAAEITRRGGESWLDNPNMKAWMGVPLNAPAYTLGVMCVGSTNLNITYTDEQLKILWQIADQAATAIDKARLFRETEIRARQLNSLNQISTQLATVFQEPDRLLELITLSAVGILEAEAGSLLLVDPETGELEFRVASGEDADDLVGTRLPPGTGLVGTVADRGEPVIVNDTTRDPRWFSGVDADTGVRTTTLMAAPLIASTGVIGVLEVINKQDGGVFVEDDKRLLTTFAGQAAIAIENARLFQMTDQQLAARVDELDTMQQIDRQLNETLELLRVFEITLDWALKESGATAGALGVVQDEPPSIRIGFYRGYPEDSIEARFDSVWPLNQGIMGRVVRTGNPELVSDVSIDSDYVEILPGAASQLTVPLFTGGRVTGVIILESVRSNAFGLLTLDFISRLAEHASPAIANAALFSQLERANESRSEFVGFVAHELKTPMTSIKGFADLLLGGVVGPVNEQQRGFLSTIRGNVERMNTLVSDLNDVTKLQTDRMYMEKSPIQFRNVVVETLRPLQQQIEDKGQDLDMQVPEDLPLVYGDQNRLIQVLTNLITNAHKYTPPSGAVTIMAEAGRNVWSTGGPSEVLHVTVKDNGIGISEEDRARLFTPYFRSSNPLATEQPGTGLGLVIVRGIVEQHDGQIWVESTLGEGSTFHFTVPLASVVTETRAAADPAAAD